MKPVFQSDVITSKTEAHYGNQSGPMLNIIICRLAERNHPRNPFYFKSKSTPERRGPSTSKLKLM